MKISKKILIVALTIIVVLPIAVFAQTESLAGEKAYAEGDYLKAIKLFSAAINDGDVTQENWRFLGMSFVHLKKKGFAKKAFKRADKLKRRKSNDAFKHHKVTGRIYVRPTRESERNRVQGEIRMAIEFLKDGSVGVVYPYKKLPYGLTEKVVEAIRKVEFEPAMRDGKKITTVGTLSYRFSIN